MGTFATTTSLQTLLPNVVFDTATTALCSTCITWAEGYVRTKLSRRYNMSTSPFDSYANVPTSLTSITEQMAMGFYFKNSSRGSKESISRGDALIKEARAQIDDIADFKTDLLSNTYTVITGLAQVYASTSAYHTTFNEDDPINWNVDQNKLNDIADERLL